MAKARYVKPITNKTLKALNAIGDNVSNQIAVSLREVAYGAQKVAQERLLSTYGDTTQELSPSEAVNEIGVTIQGDVPFGHKYKRYKATVYAPINKRYSNAMIYLEYGAGLGSIRRKPVINQFGANVWTFPVNNKQVERMRKIGKGLAMQIIKNNRPLMGSAVFETNFKGHQYMGIANKSQRVGYMKKARSWILQNASATTIKNLNLALRRPYYKSMQ